MFPVPLQYIIDRGRLRKLKYFCVICQPTVASVSGFPSIFSEKVSVYALVQFLLYIHCSQQLCRCWVVPLRCVTWSRGLCVGSPDRIWGRAGVLWGPWALVPGVGKMSCEDTNLWYLTLGALCAGNWWAWESGIVVNSEKEAKRKFWVFPPCPRPEKTVSVRHSETVESFKSYKC